MTQNNNQKRPYVKPLMKVYQLPAANNCSRHRSPLIPTNHRPISGKYNKLNTQRS